MVDKRALQSERYSVTDTEANIGNAIPKNMRRYIYRVKVQEDSNNINKVQLKKKLGEEDAEVVDQFVLTARETYIDPKQLTEDSLPLYIISGSTAAADRYLRAVGTDDASLLLEYEDSE